MPLTLVPLPLPADAAQRETLQKLFASAGYLLLKEIVAAHCIMHQCKAAEALCYSADNDDAKDVMNSAIKLSGYYSRALDILDELEEMPEKWVRVKVETRS